MGADPAALSAQCSVLSAQCSAGKVLRGPVVPTQREMGDQSHRLHARRKEPDALRAASRLSRTVGEVAQCDRRDDDLHDRLSAPEPRDGLMGSRRPDEAEGVSLHPDGRSRCL